MPVENNTDVDTADREIVTTRVFSAPRELVFDAWADPQQIVKWWGPRGFTTTMQEMELRPGGVWNHVMHGPDGTDYPNRSVFTEVVRPERIAYSHGGRGPGGPEAEFHMTANFEDLGDGKTRLTMRMVFPSADARDQVVRAYGAIEGGRQTVERLDEELARTQYGDDGFTISRVFDAPRDRVWQAWTDGKSLAKWWGPKGFTMLSATLDLRPGGLFHYGMRAPNGMEMWGKFVFRAIAPPASLIFVNSFSDKDRGIQRHFASPNWPLEMLTAVSFAEQAGKTALTIPVVPLNATAEERSVFRSAYGSMQQGFGGTLEQLGEFLAGN